MNRKSQSLTFSCSSVSPSTFHRESKSLTN